MINRKQEADVTHREVVAVRGDIHGAAVHRWWVYALLGVLFLLMAAFVFGISSRGGGGAP